MADSRTQAVVFLCWAMLLAGAGLSVLGLLRSLLRYRHWRTVSREDDGDIVIGDGRLAAGQAITLAPGERMLSSDPSGVIDGQIESITRKHCVLALDSGSGLRKPAAWSRAGAMITVSATAASEIYRFTARIRDVQTMSGRLRLIVSRPPILSCIQRRKHARVRLQVPASFERIDASDCGAIHATVRDISGGGLRAEIGGILRMHELDAMLVQYQPGTTVRIALPFPALPRNAILARVRSSGRAVTAGGLTLQVACEFLPMPEWEQEIVIRHVFQFQREQLRTGKMRRHDCQPGFSQ